MESDKNSTRRCGQIGEEEDDMITLADALKEQERLKAEADAVLGGSDSKNCTYPEGYLKRQAVYACATCNPDGHAGICLACSYACHEGHDLFELYTKRNFRCDCGNEKFGGVACKLYPNKSEPNFKNRYSQNFRGNYCSCSRPYPDPEDTVEDEMIQCVVCEDWYHSRHLVTPVPDSDFSEMICPGCMTRNSFLWAYQVNSEETIKLSAKEEKCDDLDVLKTESPESHSQSSEVSQSEHNSVNNNIDMKTESSGEGVKVHNESVSQCCDVGSKRPGENLDESSPPKKLKQETKSELKTDENNLASCSQGDSSCLLKVLVNQTPEDAERATFWQDGWRKKLCRCEECKAMYEDKGIEFLLDEGDTVKEYEEKGRNSEDSEEEEADASALMNGMDRVTQIEVVRGIVDLKTQMKEFLEKFAREGKVVTESDIREFFQNMEQRRQQNQFGMPQSFCR